MFILCREWSLTPPLGVWVPITLCVMSCQPLACETVRVSINYLACASLSLITNPLAEISKKCLFYVSIGEANIWSTWEWIPGLVLLVKLFSSTLFINDGFHLFLITTVQASNIQKIWKMQDVVYCCSFDRTAERVPFTWNE